MTPQTALKPAEISQPAWIEAIATPLPGTECGDDPRYSDDFGTIKHEIDKLKGNNFPKIKTLCIELLSTQSKDLRIAGYLALASIFTAGIDGLIDAVRAYQILVDRFGEECHPHKESMRLTAIAWLNNSKLESYLRHKIGAAGPTQIVELRALIDAVNLSIETVYGEEAPRWTSLNRVLDKALKNLPEPAVPEAKAAEVKPQLAAAPTPQSMPPSTLTTGVNSERELVTVTRSIHDYLLRSNDLPRAIAYTRALRWGALQLPPHANGKTRIPAPRQSALNELQQLSVGNNPEALLMLCENLFLEGSGHLLLDLQRIAFEAAQQQGRNDLAEFIAQQSMALLRRVPELTGLQFDNGLPFADLNTRSWVEERLAPQTDVTIELEAWEEELDALFEKGRKLLRKKQLPEALGLFKQCPPYNQKQHLQLKLAEVRLCLEGGRPEIALPVIEELAHQLEQKSLQLWDSSLATEVWKQQLEVSQACLKKVTGEDKKLLAATIDQLKRKICNIDLEAAARLL
ncbi:MAG: type VI secretion system protein TssA [Desulfuromonas sp.]